MRIGVLGTGEVGRTIGSKLVSLGHDVMLGARSPTNEAAEAWTRQAGHGAKHGTFAAAAAHGELVFNCTAGRAVMEVAAAAGPANLAGKILVDVSNPLDFSQGMPPRLLFPGNDSLGERLQRALPQTRVVKSLNTVTCAVMVDPARVPGEHDVFVAGNDAAAKARVAEILRDWFGWQSIVDFGDITGARGLEAYILFWVRGWQALGTADFNIRLMR